MTGYLVVLLGVVGPAPLSSNFSKEKIRWQVSGPC